MEIRTPIFYVWSGRRLVTGMVLAGRICLNKSLPLKFRLTNIAPLNQTMRTPSTVQQDIAKLIKLDLWVREKLCDPVTKAPLTDKGSFLVSPTGKEYGTICGAFDFRLSLSHEWLEGQKGYEHFHETIQDDRLDYKQEIEGIREIYDAFPLQGKVLDVGGGVGRLRAFIPKENHSDFVSIDPFVELFANLESTPRLVKAYPFLREPVNFVCGNAESLPFKDGVFDCVHIRSVLDHLDDPIKALRESGRVMKKDGKVVIGLTVLGGRNGLSFKRKTKKAIKRVLVKLGLWKEEDHHMFHPTHKQLMKIITAAGFKVVREKWQTAEPDVVYVLAAKA